MQHGGDELETSRCSLLAIKYPFEIHGLLIIVLFVNWLITMKNPVVIHHLHGRVLQSVDKETVNQYALFSSFF